MGSGGRDRPDPEDLSLWQAVQRYLRHRQVDATESSVNAWAYRLKLFAEWTESIGIDRVGALEPYDLVEYYELRSVQVEPSTLQGEMSTLKALLEFLEDLADVEDLADSVPQPDVDDEDLSSDERLETEDAMALLEFYRASDEFASRDHVFLELAWLTGARAGGIRGLDIRDVAIDDSPYVEFRQRAHSGTPLKNKYAGERAVALPEETGRAIREYIDVNRFDVRDDHGRQPLLASTQGRPHPNTVRVWSYLATQPCLHSPCPHGKERPTCEWTNYNQGSKCPSSRSPHPIRTGSITWMLDMGWPIEKISARVNATVKTIRKHYDKASLDERRLRQRDAMQDRRHFVDNLDLPT